MNSRERKLPSAKVKKTKKNKKTSLFACILRLIGMAYKTLANNRVLVMLIEYCFVLLVGVAWFLLHPEEKSSQQEEGVEMTFIDAAFFATVRRYPQTHSFAKACWLTVSAYSMCFDL